MRKTRKVAFHLPEDERQFFVRARRAATAERYNFSATLRLAYRHAFTGEGADDIQRLRQAYKKELREHQ